MNIRKKLIASSLWSVATTVTSLLSGFVVFSVLARLLQPAEFGIVAFAAIFTELARGLVTAGIPEALIQREKWDDTAASTAFWANLAASMLIALAMSIAGALIILAGPPVLGAVFIALAAGLIIDGARAIHEAKLRREFGYKALALRTLSANFSAGVVGIVLALQGFGVWALVANHLVSAVLKTYVIWRSAAWRPCFVFSKEELRHLSRFGGSLLTARTFSEVTKRVPELAIGFVLGPAALATYRVGFRGLQFLIQTTISPLQTTSLSALSRLPKASVGDGYLRLTSATALVSFPTFLGAAVVAPDFVAVCFGEKWASSAAVMAALALMVAPTTLTYFAAPALTAVGKTRLIIVSSFAHFVSNALVTLVTVPFGVVAVAAGLTARAHLVAPIPLLMLREGVGLPVRKTATSLIGPGVAAGIMALGVMATRMFVLNDTGPLVRLLVSAILGCVIYVVLLFVLTPRYTSQMIREVLPFLPPRLQKIASWTIRRL
jgi:PST family polysaccharide transporter